MSTRGRKKIKKDGTYFLNTKLNQIFKPGTKKEEANKNEIRSYTSMKGYKYIGIRFVKFCIENGVNDFKNMSKMVPEFLMNEKNKGRSIASLKTYRSALNKIFDIDNEKLMQEICDFYYEGDYNKMRNEWKFSKGDIKRSRDYYYPNQIKDDIPGTLANDIKIICIGTGLRRRELESITPSNIEFISDKEVHLWLTANKTDAAKRGSGVVKCKGGRSRDFIIDDQDSIKMLKKYCQNIEPNQPIMKNFNISHSQDIHSYRAIFANNIYMKFAKKINEIDENKRIKSQRPKRSKDGLISPIITLRGDFNASLDREACRIVSQYLGHNRENVFVDSYFRRNLIPKEYIIKF